jgi:vacuolar-type H+-ATPase subunit E/Vma4
VTLEAARDALLADARAAARRMLDEAETEAEARLESARREAEETIAHARAQGIAEGRVDAAHEEARERTFARMDVLAAQRESYDELRRRAREAVLGLREEPGYAELLERLAAAARRELGADAELEIDPADGGGVRGRAGSRRVDYTLPALADRCVDDLGTAAQRLWT